MTGWGTDPHRSSERVRLAVLAVDRTGQAWLAHPSTGNQESHNIALADLHEALEAR